MQQTPAPVIEALDRMLEVFDHPGLLGLVLKGKRHGWTRAHVDAMTKALIYGRAVSAHAHGRIPPERGEG